MAALIAIFVMPGAARAAGLQYSQVTDFSNTIPSGQIATFTSISSSTAITGNRVGLMVENTTGSDIVLGTGSYALTITVYEPAVHGGTGVFGLTFCDNVTIPAHGVTYCEGTLNTVSPYNDWDLGEVYTVSISEIHSGLEVLSDQFMTGFYGFITLNGGTAPPLPNPSHITRIVSMTPEEGTTTGSTVDFDLHVYINPDDLSFINGIQLYYQNIDQNQVVAGIPGLSKSELLVLAQATTSGDIYFHASRTLPDGNYRVQGKIERTLVGLVKNPNDDVNETQNHQYIVNQATYIGHLNQLGFKELNGILASTTATSTEASGLNCSPTTFHIVPCLAFLFIPGGAQLDDTMSSFRSGIATRMPWGYFYRMYAIFTTTSTSSLPAFVATIPIGPPSNLSTTSLSFDMNDMIAGGGQLAASITDGRGHTIRDITEPIIRLVIALMVIIIIWHDITSQAHHPKMQKTKQ